MSVDDMKVKHENINDVNKTSTQASSSNVFDNDLKNV